MSAEPSNTRTVVEGNGNRYETQIGGYLAGFTQFADRGRQRIFFHTEIDQAHQGKGLSSVRIEDALADTRDAGLRVVPLCPAVASCTSGRPQATNSRNSPSPTERAAVLVARGTSR